MKKTYLTLFSILAFVGSAVCQNTTKENEPSWTEVKSDKNVTISISKTKCGDGSVLLLKLENKSMEKHLVTIGVPAGVSNIATANVQLSVNPSQILEGGCTSTKTFELTWFFNGSIPENLNVFSNVN